MLQRKILKSCAALLLAFALTASLCSCSFIEYILSDPDIINSIFKTGAAETGTNGTSPAKTITPQNGPEKSGKTTETVPDTTEEPVETKEPVKPVTEKPAWKDTYVPGYGSSPVKINKVSPISEKDYYFKNKLTDKGEIAAYEVLEKMVKSLSDNAAFTEKIGRTSAEKVVSLFLADHPEVFWLQSSYYVTGPENALETIRFTLAYTTDEIIRMKRSIESVANEILSRIPSNAADIEAELIIYNWLADNLTYEKDVSNPYTLYSALVEKKCVCEGYAEAFQYLCYKVGIPCVGLSGKATNSAGKTENHKWNGVRIGGKWYMTDVTFGDGGETQKPLYFNSSKRIFENHVLREPFDSLAPGFTAEGAEYFHYYGLVLHEDDLYDVFMRSLGHFTALASPRSGPSVYVLMLPASDSVRSYYHAKIDPDDPVMLSEVLSDFNKTLSSGRFIVYDYDDSGIIRVRIVRMA